MCVINQILAHYQPACKVWQLINCHQHCIICPNMEFRFTPRETKPDPQIDYQCAVADVRDLGRLLRRQVVASLVSQTEQQLAKSSISYAFEEDAPDGLDGIKYQFHKYYTTDSIVVEVLMANGEFDSIKVQRGSLSSPTIILTNDTVTLSCRDQQVQVSTTENNWQIKIADRLINGWQEYPKAGDWQEGEGKEALADFLRLVTQRTLMEIFGEDQEPLLYYDGSAVWP